MTPNEIGLKYGIVDGFTIHSNKLIAKKKFQDAMEEYGKQQWNAALDAAAESHNKAFMIWGANDILKLKK